MCILALIAAAAAATTTPVPVPGGEGGIGFDDLVFSPRLHRLIVPGGRTGNLDLLDPATREFTAISGFSKESKFGGGHGEGTTSADEGRGLLFASDRSKRLLGGGAGVARHRCETRPRLHSPLESRDGRDRSAYALGRRAVEERVRGFARYR